MAVVCKWVRYDAWRWQGTWWLVVLGKEERRLNNTADEKRNAWELLEGL